MELISYVTFSPLSKTRFPWGVKYSVVAQPPSVVFKEVDFLPESQRGRRYAVRLEAKGDYIFAKPAHRGVTFGEVSTRMTLNVA